MKPKTPRKGNQKPKRPPITPLGRRLREYNKQLRKFGKRKA